MYLHFRNHEKGQSLVIIALMLVALIGILALTLDGGLSYVQRRRAQNAADSGALAGARAMCLDLSDPVGVAEEYAEKNGIPYKDDDGNGLNDYITVNALTKGNDGSYPGWNTIEVSVDLPYDTFFAQVLGFNDTEVGATAKAGCGAPCGASTLPIAWSCTPLEEDIVENGGVFPQNCDVDYVDVENNQICKFGEPNSAEVYIVVDTKTIEDEIFCLEEGEVVPDPIPEGYVDCDVDNNGTNDFEILSGGNRAWLDLNGSLDQGGGANELIKFIDGTIKLELFPHTWFPGQTGAISSIYQALNNLEGKYVVVPVFNGFYRGDLYSDFNNEVPAALAVVHTLANDGVEDTIIDNNGVGVDYFHVVTYASFYVSCVEPSNEKSNCPLKDYLASIDKKYANESTVEGCFYQGILETRSSAQAGEVCATVDGGSYVLKLIK